MKLLYLLWLMSLLASLPAPAHATHDYENHMPYYTDAYTGERHYYDRSPQATYDYSLPTYPDTYFDTSHYPQEQVYTYYQPPQSRDQAIAIAIAQSFPDSRGLQTIWDQSPNYFQSPITINHECCQWWSQAYYRSRGWLSDWKYRIDSRYWVRSDPAETNYNRHRDTRYLPIHYGESYCYYDPVNELMYVPRDQSTDQYNSLVQTLVVQNVLDRDHVSNLRKQQYHFKTQ